MRMGFAHGGTSPAAVDASTRFRGRPAGGLGGRPNTWADEAANCPAARASVQVQGETQPCSVVARTRSQHKWHSQGAGRPELKHTRRQKGPCQARSPARTSPWRGHEGSTITMRSTSATRALGIHSSTALGIHCARRSRHPVGQFTVRRLAAHAGVARLSISACLYKVSAS